jgi:hypothetical protein
MDEPLNHCCETCLVLTTDSLELQAESTPGHNVSHGSIGGNLPVFYKKIEFDGRIYGAHLRCLKKKTTHTQVFDARNIFNPPAPPDGPHAIRRFNALVVPS